VANPPDEFTNDFQLPAFVIGANALERDDLGNSNLEKHRLVVALKVDVEMIDRVAAARRAPGD
jgi:hypothetical protein